MAITDSASPMGGDANAASSTAQVKAGLKKRYRAERRFKMLGIGAIGFALFWLAILFFTIFSNGLPAFWQTQLTMVVTLSEDVIDPQGTRDPKTLSTADYQKLVRDALYVQFPEVTGRRDKRALSSVVSGGAAFELRDRVVADPSLIGQKLEIAFPTSDDVDVFVKGNMTPISHRNGRGIGSIVDAGGTVTVYSSSNDFTEILQEVKATLEAEAKRRDAEAANLQASLDAMNRRLTGGGLNDATREEVTAERDIMAARIADIQEDANALHARAKQAGGTERLESWMPSYLVRMNDGYIKLETVGNTEATGTAVVKPKSLGDAPAGTWDVMMVQVPEGSRRMKDQQIAFVEILQRDKRIASAFNTIFFTAGDSRSPELAGVRGALMGSLFTLAVTLLASFPLAVGAAIYLEEFAPKNRWTDLIEVNINNLAAVPSIVFGLLGLAVFLNVFGMPRSAPLVGGLVLALMTLPTIIIASRAALKAVPPSIREAALGLGASKVQAVFHHVLPLASPGILTGTIIGMAQALGETAPLLMIGMVAFIVDVPGSFTDPSTVLPVQIYLWSDSPERAFMERTSAAIIVLLCFLVLMNVIAVFLRKKFERRW